MRLKTKNIFIGALSFLMFASCGLGFSLYEGKQVAAEEVTTNAIFIHEDKGTKGTWFNGENGAKDNPEADRNYGKDAAIIPMHWSRKNGRAFPLENREIIFDYSEDTNYYYNFEKANYVEYPEYVSEVSVDVESFNYWMNTPRTLEAVLASVGGKDRYTVGLLPIDTDKHVGTDTLIVDGGINSSTGFNYTFTVTDNDWHVVSAYIGCPYYHKYIGYEEAIVSMYSLDGQLLTKYTVEDVNVGCYVSFAFQGSFVMRIENAAAGGEIWLNGIFFDPYEEDANIGVQNITSSLEGGKQINLTWENKSAASHTAIYRKEKSATVWEKIATLEPGVTTYSDMTSVVNKEYQYMLTSGNKRTVADSYYPYGNVVDIVDFNIPKETEAIDQNTAPYKKTSVQFVNAVDSTYYRAAQNEAVEIKVKAEKFDEQQGFIPYEEMDVSFELQGDNVYSIVGAESYLNMQNELGVARTNAEGFAVLTCALPYVGEYKLVASIAAVADENDEMQGYDGASASIEVVIYDETTQNVQKPILTTVSEAIEPGETLNVMGFNMYEDEMLRVAIAKNKGAIPGEYDESGEYTYLDRKDILTVDDQGGTGISFILPRQLENGVYDIWVYNSFGWSRGITLNAARPMYIDQSGAYAGQKIQIVGRNFYQAEYGVGTETTSLASLRVKLTEITTNQETVLSVENGGIKTGVRANAKDSATAENIPYTNPYKITIVIPQIEAGQYKISVASDGVDYRALEEAQLLNVVEKKAQSWNTDVFGGYGATHVGNDPLDLGVYWAQDFNYNDVAIMEPNTIDQAQTLTATINTAIKQLKNGGVVYFPAGTYYTSEEITIASNVILVGAGVDKTTIVYASKEVNTIWFKSKNTNNVGIARMTLKLADEYKEQHDGVDKWYAPNRVLAFDDAGYDVDIANATSQNKFVTDLNVEMKGGNYVQPAFQTSTSLLVCARENVLLRNVTEVAGGGWYVRAHKYLSLWNYRGVDMFCSTPILQCKYTVVENSVFDGNYTGESHGPSLRSEAYIAFCYTANMGRRTNLMNDGEALLVEMPHGDVASGWVLAATARTVTLDFVGGEKISADTYVHYNGLAVYISEGKGAGQMRYIKKVGTGDYTNCYELLDSEADWDVLPDTTSRFSVILPIVGTTVYRYQAENCIATICLYQNNFGSLVKECTLKNTGGISVDANSTQFENGRICPSGDIRIEDNDISGISASFALGAKSNYLGGIYINARRDFEYLGYLISNIVIRDNYIHDVRNETETESLYHGGIALLSKGKEGQDAQIDAKFIIVEDNTIKNSDGGIISYKRYSNVIVRNNTIEDIKYSDERFNIYTTANFAGYANHELYVDGTLLDISGEYQYQEALPEAPEKANKVFIGWSNTEQLTDNSVVSKLGYGYNTKLYAVYGYTVVFDWNYTKADGTARGEYVSLDVIENYSVKAQLEEAGAEPFRLDYQFGGWYTDAACTNAYDVDSEVSSNMRLYAKWIPEHVDEPPVDDAEPFNPVPLIIIISVSAVVAAGAVVTVIILKRKKRN